jgi:hypothetical protein
MCARNKNIIVVCRKTACVCVMLWTVARVAHLPHWLGYGLYNRRIMLWLPVGSRDLTLIQSVQTGSRACSTSYSMTDGGTRSVIVLCIPNVDVSHQMFRTSDSSIMLRRVVWIYTAIEVMEEPALSSLQCYISPRLFFSLWACYSTRCC